jgi:hypothetical protein
MKVSDVKPNMRIQTAERLSHAWKFPDIEGQKFANRQEDRVGYTIIEVPGYHGEAWWVKQVNGIAVYFCNEFDPY